MPQDYLLELVGCLGKELIFLCCESEVWHIIRTILMVIFSNFLAKLLVRKWCGTNK